MYPALILWALTVPILAARALPNPTPVVYPAAAVNGHENDGMLEKAVTTNPMNADHAASIDAAGGVQGAHGPDDVAEPLDGLPPPRPRPLWQRRRWQRRGLSTELRKRNIACLTSAVVTGILVGLTGAAGIRFKQFSKVYGGPRAVVQAARKQPDDGYVVVPFYSRYFSEEFARTFGGPQIPKLVRPGYEKPREFIDDTLSLKSPTALSAIGASSTATLSTWLCSS